MRYTRAWRQLGRVKTGGRLWSYRLILAHNNIESLREDHRNFPLLSVLNVSRYKLSHLPALLHMLKSLDVSFNVMAGIPEEVGSATSLVNSISCGYIGLIVQTTN